ncbi:hypothetical protein T07_8754 [Trichinella nelsoni]|uniref:Uncharacterized protein n=1 Tax=Trichinella nelsoni TaxID=6336 RepID=A0A0V0RKJ7_9BILA|nr:hypothetical protein T07_8754 [Trichinella nelsoni]
MALLMHDQSVITDINSGDYGSSFDFKNYHKNSPSLIANMQNHHEMKLNLKRRQTDRQTDRQTNQQTNNQTDKKETNYRGSVTCHLDPSSSDSQPQRFLRGSTWTSSKVPALGDASDLCCACRVCTCSPLSMFNLIGLSLSALSGDDRRPPPPSTPSSGCSLPTG